MSPALTTEFIIQAPKSATRKYEKCSTSRQLNQLSMRCADIEDTQVFIFILHQIALNCICKRNNMDFQKEFLDHLIPSSGLFALLMMFKRELFDEKLALWLWNVKSLKDQYPVSTCNRMHVNWILLFRPNSTGTVFVIAIHQFS